MTTPAQRLSRQRCSWWGLGAPRAGTRLRSVILDTRRFPSVCLVPSRSIDRLAQHGRLDEVGWGSGARLSRDIRHGTRCVASRCTALRYAALRLNTICVIVQPSHTLNATLLSSVSVFNYLTMVLDNKLQRAWIVVQYLRTHKRRMRGILGTDQILNRCSLKAGYSQRLDRLVRNNVDRYNLFRIIIILYRREMSQANKSMRPSASTIPLLPFFPSRTVLLPCELIPSHPVGKLTRLPVLVFYANFSSLFQFTPLQ